MINRILVLTILFYFPQALSASYDTSYSTGSDSYRLNIEYPDDGYGGIIEFITYHEKTPLYIGNSQNIVETMSTCRSERPAVYPVNAFDKQMGWMVVAQGSCDDISKKIVALISPRESKYEKAISTDVTVFYSDNTPIITPVLYGADIRFYQRIKGRNNKAPNVLLPRKFTVKQNRYKTSVKKGDILPDLLTAEVGQTNFWQDADFLSFYLVGLSDNKPELMSHALLHYYNPLNTKHYEGHLQKADKNTLEDIVTLMRMNKVSLEEIRKALLFLWQEDIYLIK